jgi:hypothetical protein
LNVAKSHTGACQCGAHRFETSGEPRFVANCHCQDCRRATGAAFSTWVGWTEKQVRWTTESPASFASSPGVERGFCKQCGTPLTYCGSDWPGEVHILIGTYDEPDSFAPSGSVFIDEGLDWAKPEPAPCSKGTTKPS